MRIVIALLACLLAMPAAAQTLPDIALRDAKDNSASLSSFHGRYVLLNFWASYCAPCVKEMPALQRLQQRYGGADFTVLPISVEAGLQDSIQSFYDYHDLEDLPLYALANRRDMLRLKLIGIPTTILLDPAGKIVWRYAGIMDWDDPATARKLPASLTVRKQASLP